jgi:hypothetical protein
MRRLNSTMSTKAKTTKQAAKGITLVGYSCVRLGQPSNHSFAGLPTDWEESGP